MYGLVDGVDVSRMPVCALVADHKGSTAVDQVADKTCIYVGQEMCSPVSNTKRRVDMDSVLLCSGSQGCLRQIFLFDKPRYTYV